MSAESKSATSEGAKAASAGAASHPETRRHAIFISYRRDDTEGESGRLYDDLVEAYGDSSVFMDVAGIQPGIDFRQAIDDNVASCGVLLAIIGPTWATITGHDGTRRLDNPSDYVRLEIALALKRGIPVIPVLVHEAHMPALEQLPDDLKDLRYRNSVEITHARWRSDVDLFITALKAYVDPRPKRPEATVHATVPVQLPAPQLTPPPKAEKPRPPFSLGLALGGLTVVTVLALLFFFVLRPRWQARHQPAVESNPSTAVSSTTPGTAPAPTPTTTPATTPASAAATTTPSTTGPASGATIPVAMVGIWKTTTKVGPKSDTLDQLSIVEFGGKFSARAYGACLDKPCDWGVRKLTMDNGYAVSEKPWEPRNTPKDASLQRKVSVSMALSGDTLLVTVKNQTVDPSRGPLFGMRDMQFKKTQ